MYLFPYVIICIDTDLLVLWTKIESMILEFGPVLPMKVKSEGSDFIL